MKPFLLAFFLANSLFPFSQSILDNRDQRTYPYVSIGESKWFADNLKFNENYSYFYNQTSDQVYYGQKSIKYDTLCPEGWRVPTLVDWEDVKEDLNRISTEKGNGWVNSGKYVPRESVYWALSNDDDDESSILIVMDSEGLGFEVAEAGQGTMASCRCIADN